MTTRISAGLLLALFLLPLFALWVSIGSVSDAMLPACCRAHGKHHCSMRGIEARSADSQKLPPAFTSSQGCPFQNLGPASHVPAYGSPVGLSEREAFARATLIASRQNRGAFYQIFHHHPKRGPPHSSDISHEA
jgi:hypothetical protein